MVMKIGHGAYFVAVCAAALSVSPDPAYGCQETGRWSRDRLGPNNEIVVGEYVTIHSTVLNEDRDILLYLPSDYSTSRMRYPVVYLLDGDFFFLATAGVVEFLAKTNNAPEMIVVAVVSTDRMNELSPSAGGTDFTSFLSSELMPYMSENFRTEPYNILAGHSLGGLFVIHALLEHPQLFDAYIAASPALFWDGRSELTMARGVLDSLTSLNKFLYLTYSAGDGNNIRSATDDFVALLERGTPPDLKWEFTFLPNDRHNTSPLISVHAGLQLLFSRWAYLGPDDATQMEAHYLSLSEEFGFECKPPEGVVASRGRNQTRRGNIREAIKLYQYNARLYPGSANVYEDLGALHLGAGNRELARENYEKSLELNPDRPSIIEILRQLRSPSLN